MNLFFDNIIFSLQQFGGISVVWYELLQRILKEEEIDSRFFDFPNNNILRSTLNISDFQLMPNSLVRFPLKIQRYSNPKIKGKGIFHSSYYRITKSTNIVNITTVHDFTYEYFRTGLPKIIHQRQKEAAIKNSQRIICVSQNTKNDLLKFYPKTNPDHITVIHNGVNEIYRSLTNNEESELKKLMDFDSGEYILFVGDRKSDYKNFKIVVKACLIAKLPLIMVGSKLNPQENSFLIETLGQNKFKLLHGINNDQLNLVYNHAFCLLYPSSYEGFGIPILEAQRAGCPIITSNSSSIPEVSGKGAVLLNEITEFHIADIIKELKSDSSLIKELRNLGFENSQRFSWEKCYQETKQVYQEIYQEYF